MNTPPFLLAALLSAAALPFSALAAQVPQVPQMPQMPQGAPAVTTAQGAGGSLQVGATILVSCTMSGTALNFGSGIDPLLNPGPVDASAVLSVSCTNTTPYTVALNAGLNAGGNSNFGGRAMKSGSHNLPYQLYLDAARSKIWGNGSSSELHSGTGTGGAQSLTIYGRLPSLAGAVPGSYADTVTVTISY